MQTDYLKQNSNNISIILDMKEVLPNDFIDILLNFEEKDSSFCFTFFSQNEFKIEKL